MPGPWELTGQRGYAGGGGLDESWGVWPAPHLLFRTVAMSSVYEDRLL